MKKLFALILAVLMVASMVACTAQPAAPVAEEPTATEAPVAEEPVAEAPEAEMTEEELIEAAKAEGTLNVYGVHSYIEKAAAAFSEKYGIDVVWTQLGETELIEKVSGECAAAVSGGADAAAHIGTDRQRQRLVQLQMPGTQTGKRQDQRGVAGLQHHGRRHADAREQQRRADPAHRHAFQIQRSAHRGKAALELVDAQEDEGDAQHHAAGRLAAFAQKTGQHAEHQQRQRQG